MVVNQKSVAVSYVLWFFLGMLGIHKFYLRQPIQGVVFLVLAVLGWATVFFIIGYVVLAVVWIGLIVDLYHARAGWDPEQPGPVLGHPHAVARPRRPRMYDVGGPPLGGGRPASCFFPAEPLTRGRRRRNLQPNGCR